jgi:hypothetical protein
MEIRRVLIVGDTLFAENLAKLLAEDTTIHIAGNVASLEDIPPALQAGRLDAVIVAGVDRLPETVLSRFLALHPEISVLCTDLDTNDIRVVVNQRLSVRTTSDLLAIISALPRRN